MARLYSSTRAFSTSRQATNPTPAIYLPSLLRPVNFVLAIIKEAVLAAPQTQDCCLLLGRARGTKLCTSLAEQLRQLPRSVKLLSSERGSLSMQWMNTKAENLYRLCGIDMKVMVVLHRNTTCGNRRRVLRLPRRAMSVKHDMSFH